MTPDHTSRYWDYPFENCMVRATQTNERLDIGIKFYGKEEWLVDFDHEIYIQIRLGGGTETDAETYRRGKQRPPPQIYTGEPKSSTGLAGDAIAKAVAFAITHHGDQRRKDANLTPYAAHLFAVAALALEDGGSQDHAMAALLHDTLEDCSTVTTEVLIAEFGETVADIVIGCTDHTPGALRGGWRERKEAYLEHLRHADQDVLLVSNADKLHNLSSLLADFSIESDPIAVLNRFSSPDGVLWYYRQLASVFEMQRAGHRNQQRFANAVNQLQETLSKSTHPR